MRLLLLIFVLASCSLFRSKDLSTNIPNEIRNICLAGSGVGRIKTQGRKFPFTFEMGKEESLWLIGISFPLHSQDVFEVDLETGKYSDDIERRILKKVKGIDPFMLSSFLKAWSELIFEINKVQTGVNRISKWNIDKDTLEKSIGGRIKIKFSSKNEFFEVMELDILGRKPLKLDLHVRECLKM